MCLKAWLAISVQWRRRKRQPVMTSEVEVAAGRFGSTPQSPQEQPASRRFEAAPVLEENASTSAEFRRKATAPVALTEFGPRGLSGSAPPCLEGKNLRANKAHALCEAELHDLLLTLAQARRVGEGDGRATRCSLARRGA